LDAAPARTQVLTIGQSIPLVSLQREASDLRKDLAQIGPKKRLWIDVSAGRDPLGFHGVDQNWGSARNFSANLGRSFSSQTLRRLKWRGFDMHFLYFKAAESKGANWDWFGVLAGQKPLKERFSVATPDSALKD
jgi:hypothetical protein